MHYGESIYPRNTENPLEVLFDPHYPRTDEAIELALRDLTRGICEELKDLGIDPVTEEDLADSN